MRRVIALLTDFGIKDPYVGMMKAVITSINPEVSIIDLTHEAPKYNIVLGAHILKVSYKYFPKGTIFTVVIDPGVGSSRRAVILESTNYLFVGPDNGVMVPAAKDDGLRRAYEINTEVAALPRISYTFHGRDVFAPTAAYLSLGMRPSSLGNEVPLSTLVTTDELPKKPRVSSEGVTVEVVHIDDFGNLILSSDLSSLTNYLRLELGDYVGVKVVKSGEVFRARVCRTFSQVGEGELALYEGSYRLAEIAVFKGSASRELGVNAGDELVISKSLTYSSR